MTHHSPDGYDQPGQLAQPGSPGSEDWTDDQLSALLGAIRRHIHAAPPGTWDAETLRAAKTVTAALSARLAASTDGLSGGV